MKKQILILGLISVSLTAFSQHTKVDSLKFNEIEDIKLHKTGNPNKARTFSTKSNLSVMETPQPISIVTHEIIEAQQAKQLSDVVKNVNGVYITSSRGGSQDSFGARGFTFGNENMFKNGAKVNSGIFPEVSSLERVEVLKGANAMLYGNVGPGGIVNMITKKPRFNFGGSVALNVGSWDTYKPTVDFYGPISKNIAFRVNGAYEKADSFRDIVNSQKHYFNPSFAFNLGENTQIIVEADYLKQNFIPDFGLGSIVDTKTGISNFNTNLKISDFLGEDWNYQTNQMTTTDIAVNHKFSLKWFLNSVISYQNYTKDYFAVERIQWNFDSSKTNSVPTWSRALNKTYTEQNFGSAQINLNGEFETGRQKHRILFGADGDYGVADSYAFVDAKTQKAFASAGSWKLNDRSTWTHIAMPDALQSTRNRIKATRFGVYAQDLVEISSQFKVLAGLRYSNLKNDDTVEKNYLSNTEKAKPKTGTKDDAFSPKAGILFTPDENMTVYATYTNSFVPNSGFTIQNEPLKPSIVNQYEVGIKKNLWDNAVAVNLSGYQILNKNAYSTAIYRADGTVNTDSTIKEFAGKILSRGVELDITGNPTKELMLIAGASYNHSVYRDTPEKTGYVENQKLVRTPAFTANGSAFYKFSKNLKGFVIGASAFYTGDRKAGWNDLKTQTQTTRMVDLKGFTTVDFSLGYDCRDFSIQGKLGNAFNAKSFNVHENYSVNPIAPRNFYITLTYKL